MHGLSYTPGCWWPAMLFGEGGGGCSDYIHQEQPRQVVHDPHGYRSDWAGVAEYDALGWVEDTSLEENFITTEPLVEHVSRNTVKLGELKKVEDHKKV
jgi:hypothetical protein